MTRRDRDLLAPLMDLPGVADAAAVARAALGKAHRHRANLRNWPITAAESTVRGARSSSALDGGGVQLDAASGAHDPVLAGALRVGQAMEGGATNIVGAWQRAPLQALARLHALAAADLVSEAHLGRPRQSPEVAARLDLLTRLVTGGSSAPAPVLAAVAGSSETGVLETLGRQIGMHVAATRPEALDIDAVDPAALERERAVLSEQARASGKPEAIIEKMVEGRIRKYYEEVVLLEQVWVHDGESRVRAVVKKAGATLTGFVRYQLGEGIEKQTGDFAAEVAAAAGATV